jgi:hypothetical protein
MKKINALMLFGLIISSTAFGFTPNYYNLGNGTVVTTPNGQQVYVPRPNNNQQNKALQGNGVTFQATLQVTEEKTKDNTGKDKTIKHYKAWVRHCNTVELPDKPEMDKTAHSGDSIQLRFSQYGSCDVQDWKKN